jgi:four helix bundle protein
MNAARTFRELRVYQLARAAGSDVFEIIKRFPKEEFYTVTDQIRRSSRATKALIAEAWGRRRYKAVFISKIDEAMGEATETQSWLDDALDQGDLSDEEFEKTDRDWCSITAMLARMIDRASDFCKYDSNTDYRGTVGEDSLDWNSEFLIEKADS